MKTLHTYIRPLIYFTSLCVGIAIYSATYTAMGTLKAVQWYGFISFAYLYFTLLASPLYTTFPKLPYRPLYFKARKALGLSSFFFALPHAYIGFFGFIQGFEGLQYWSDTYVFSMVCGFIALLIMAVLALTSASGIKKAMGARWKYTHRTVYIAGVLILIHGVTVTIHILRLTPLLIASYIAVIFLLTLESIRLDRYFSRYPIVPRHLVKSLGLPAVSGVLFWSFFLVSHHLH
ncbi:MAG: hypothetical protein RI947_1349 [Candidatus Parcubacteria bacterium]